MICCYCHSSPIQFSASRFFIRHCQPEPRRRYYENVWDEPGVYFYHLTGCEKSDLADYFKDNLKALRKKVLKLKGKDRDEAYRDVLKLKKWHREYCLFDENAYWEVGNEVMDILRDDEEGDPTVHERMMYLRHRMTRVFGPPNPEDPDRLPSLGEYVYFAPPNYR